MPIGIKKNKNKENIHALKAKTNNRNDKVQFECLNLLGKKHPKFVYVNGFVEIV